MNPWEVFSLCALCAQEALEQNCCISRPVTLSLQCLMQGQQPYSKRMGTRPNTQRILRKSLCVQRQKEGGGCFFPFKQAVISIAKIQQLLIATGGGGPHVQHRCIYLRFFLSPDSISTHCQRIALWMKSSRVCSQVTTKSNHSYFV